MSRTSSRSNPQLLRWLYVEIARSTAGSFPEPTAEFANEAGFRTASPRRNYVHYLATPSLSVNSEEYPLSKRESARTPSKITADRSRARTAVFSGPVLWESPPDTVSL